MMLQLQLSRNSGTGSQNVSETGCADSILKLSSSSSSSHVARPGLPEEMHSSRLLCEFGNQVMRQVSEKSDEIDGTRLEKTLESRRVFDL